MAAVAILATTIPCNFSEAFTLNQKITSFSLLALPSSYDRNIIMLMKRSNIGETKLATTTHLYSSTTEAEDEIIEKDKTEVSPSGNLPLIGKDGLYKIENKEQHLALLEANPEKILIVKFFAPWCRACKGLAPKFLQVKNDERYKTLPLMFADLNIVDNREYVKALGVIALPNVQIYAGSDGLVENFPCGPSKVPILKKKIANVVNDRVDPDTFDLILRGPESGDQEAVPCKERDVSVTEGNTVVSEDRVKSLRNIIYFKDFSNEEYNSLIKTTKLQTFEPGSVVMKQGKEGKNFYVIDSGQVEISIRTDYDDPLLTPSDYLGAVVNTLSKDDYFGDRALITGEPRAASIRAIEKTRCFAFNRNDIPSSSVLSGKKSASKERIEQMDDKYGVNIVNIDNIGFDRQIKNANVASQQRGSANDNRTTKKIFADEDGDENEEVISSTSISQGNLEGGFTVPKEDIVALLYRFRNIRRAARCFEYISQTQPRFGDIGNITRRSMFVSLLTPSQVDDYKAAFQVIDKSHDNSVSIEEMRSFMSTVGREKTDEELIDMMNKANPMEDGNTDITIDEFMGVMAEAEFFTLFSETLNTLDTYNSGFVKAGDIDRILGGMRDLISDDRKSLIDVDDKDMLVDYEQFSKMLLGVF